MAHTQDNETSTGGNRKKCTHNVCTAESKHIKAISWSIDHEIPQKKKLWFNGCQYIRRKRKKEKKKGRAKNYELKAKMKIRRTYGIASAFISAESTEKSKTSCSLCNSVNKTMPTTLKQKKNIFYGCFRASCFTQMHTNYK